MAKDKKTGEKFFYSFTQWKKEYMPEKVKENESEHLSVDANLTKKLIEKSIATLVTH